MTTANKEPAQAADHQPSTTAPAKSTAPATPGDSEASARAIRNVKDFPPEEHGRSPDGKPKLETQSMSLDGHTFHNDIRKMSPEARHAIRQMEERGWVRVDQIHARDLVDISKWFGQEIGVVQSPYGRLRLVLGTDDGILMPQVATDEVFVMHTHPVAVSEPGHFGLDVAVAGKHVEAVIDWSGLITYYNKSGLKNPVRNGLVEPLSGYQAAFMDAQGHIIGFARVDVVDGPNGSQLKVKE